MGRSFLTGNTTGVIGFEHHMRVKIVSDEIQQLSLKFGNMRLAQEFLVSVVSYM